MRRKQGVFRLLVGVTAVAGFALLLQPCAALAGISWEKDFKTAMHQARDAGKPVLVDFWAKWCHWCHQLDATTYQDSRVIDLAREFVAVKVDTEGSLAEVELTTKLGVETLPTIGFLSPGGRLFFGRTEFEGPERFTATLETARRLGRDVIAWETALARQPDDAAALAGLGTLLFDQGFIVESHELLSRAREADQSRPAKERKRTRRALALAEARAGKRADSRRLLEEALAIQPAEPEEDALATRALATLPSR